MINTEISKRVVTAVLLAGVTVAAIFLLESFVFTVVVGLIAAGAAWEWCYLDREMVALGWKFVFISSIVVGVPALLVFPPMLPWVLGVALFWWISMAVLMGLGGRLIRTPKWRAKKWHTLLVIFPAAAAISGLHATGTEGCWYVLACLLIVWTTDTCAYMVGRICGKTLLAPRISPAKTVEGVGGGFAGALIVGLVLYETLPIEMTFSRFDWVLLTIVTAGFSIIGDLAESAYKRGAGVKDSGWILPGHGGILDRIDSTVASSPVFVAGILFATR